MANFFAVIWTTVKREYLGTWTVMCLTLLIIADANPVCGLRKGPTTTHNTRDVRVKTSVKALPLHHVSGIALAFMRASETFNGGHNMAISSQNEQ